MWGRSTQDGEINFKKTIVTHSVMRNCSDKVSIKPFALLTHDTRPHDIRLSMK